MTSVFDGLAGITNRVFGADVVHIPAGQSARTIRAIFRSEPIEEDTGDGRPVLILSPTVSVQAADAALIDVGDEIRPSLGGEYIVVNKIANGSPASDAFTIFELEKVEE